jgi:hypothetical protein
MGIQNFDKFLEKYDIKSTVLPAIDVPETPIYLDVFGLFYALIQKNLE